MHSLAPVWHNGLVNPITRMRTALYIRPIRLHVVTTFTDIWQTRLVYIVHGENMVDFFLLNYEGQLSFSFSPPPSLPLSPSLKNIYHDIRRYTCTRLLYTVAIVTTTLKITSKTTTYRYTVCTQTSDFISVLCTASHRKAFKLLFLG